MCREVVRMVVPDDDSDWAHGSSNGGGSGGRAAICVRRGGIEYRLCYKRGEDVLRRVRDTFGVPRGVLLKLVRRGEVLDAAAAAAAAAAGKPMHLVSSTESPADECVQRSHAYWSAWRRYIASMLVRARELAVDACRGLPAALSLFLRSAVSPGASTRAPTCCRAAHTEEARACCVRLLGNMRADARPCSCSRCTEYSPAPHRHRGQLRAGEAQVLEQAAKDARLRDERRSAELARQMQDKQQDAHED